MLTNGCDVYMLASLTSSLLTLYIVYFKILWAYLPEGGPRFTFNVTSYFRRDVIFRRHTFSGTSYPCGPKLSPACNDQRSLYFSVLL